MAKTIKITAQAQVLALSRSSVKAQRAEDLTFREIADLVNWCNHQRSNLWEEMSLQEILNVYRVSIEWDTWEGWASEERGAARKAWDRAVISPGNKMAPL